MQPKHALFSPGRTVVLVKIFKAPFKGTHGKMYYQTLLGMLTFHYPYLQYRFEIRVEYTSECV
jgi:hypothetical protein